MTTAKSALAFYPRQPLEPGRAAFVACALLLMGVLSACAIHPLEPRTVDTLAPLQLEGRSLSVADLAGRINSPDLLGIDAPMRDFVARYGADQGGDRQRLLSLHGAVTGSGILDMQYDPFADGSAAETFHRGSANCLSYANLIVALAREAGFEASYQWLEVRPEWNRNGERVVVGLHVNVLVKLRNGQQYMVDIDPLPTQRVAGTRKLSDRDALALYHNNIAMDAFANGDPEQAWLHGVRALQLSPRMAHLWVNLGAIYRYAGQHTQAEHSYLYALQLDRFSHSAMSNLAVLYGIEGREEERDYWLERVAGYRQFNPYYHAWLGEEAASAGYWRKALQHYDRALELLPDDSRMLFARGLIHYQLDELNDAVADMKQAIESATLNSEVESYQQRLEEVRREQVAAA